MKAAPGANPLEKNILYRLRDLLCLNIQFIFIFDGPQRPPCKRGKIAQKERPETTRLLKDTLDHIDVPWHEAPGEAEAECARLQVLGIVDAVWSEDPDTLMFGASVLIRNVYEMKNGKRVKSRQNVLCLDMKDLRRKGVSREGIVLYAQLVGCDYAEGLRGCGPVKARELIRDEDLVKSFAGINLDSPDLGAWRAALAKATQAAPHKSPGMSMHQIFPDLRALRYCVKPKISSDAVLRGLPARGWTRVRTTADMVRAVEFLVPCFNRDQPPTWPLSMLAPLELNNRLLLGKEVVPYKTAKGSKPKSSVTFDPSALFPGLRAALEQNKTYREKLENQSALYGFGTMEDKVSKALASVKGELLRAVLETGPSSSTTGTSRGPVTPKQKETPKARSSTTTTSAKRKAIRDAPGSPSRSAKRVASGTALMPVKGNVSAGGREVVDLTMDSSQESVKITAKQPRPGLRIPSPIPW